MIYYVSKLGNDSNTGLDVDHSWLTIQKAADTLVAGDTVYVYPGIYDPFYPANSGEPAEEGILFSGVFPSYGDLGHATLFGPGANRIYYRAVHPGTVFVDGANINEYCMLTDRSFLLFEGFVFINALKAGACVRNAVFNTFYHCIAYDNGDIETSVLASGFSFTRCSGGCYNCLSYDNSYWNFEILNCEHFTLEHCTSSATRESSVKGIYCAYSSDIKVLCCIATDDADEYDSYSYALFCEDTVDLSVKYSVLGSTVYIEGDPTLSTLVGCKYSFTDYSASDEFVNVADSNFRLVQVDTGHAADSVAVDLDNAFAATYSYLTGTSTRIDNVEDTDLSDAGFHYWVGSLGEYKFDGKVSLLNVDTTVFDGRCYIWNNDDTSFLFDGKVIITSGIPEEECSGELEICVCIDASDTEGLAMDTHCYSFTLSEEAPPEVGDTTFRFDGLVYIIPVLGPEGNNEVYKFDGLLSILDTLPDIGTWMDIDLSKRRSKVTWQWDSDYHYLVRKEGSYSENIWDGVMVYSGDKKEAYDSRLLSSVIYYYTLFNSQREMVSYQPFICSSGVLNIKNWSLLDDVATKSHVVVGTFGYLWSTASGAVYSVDLTFNDVCDWIGITFVHNGQWDGVTAKLIIDNVEYSVTDAVQLINELPDSSTITLSLEFDRKDICLYSCHLAFRTKRPVR